MPRASILREEKACVFNEISGMEMLVPAVILTLQPLRLLM
jgi:hypothetical protein